MGNQLGQSENSETITNQFCSNLCGNRADIHHDDVDGMLEPRQEEDIHNQQKSTVQEEVVQDLVVNKKRGREFPKNFDYSWEKNKPDEIKAKKLSLQEQKKYLPSETIQRRHRKLGIFQINKDPETAKLQFKEEPYLIKENHIIYIGQWREGVPYGIGKILYLKSYQDEMFKIINHQKQPNNILASSNDNLIEDNNQAEKDQFLIFQPQPLSQPQQENDKSIKPQNKNIISDGKQESINLIDQMLKGAQKEIFGGDHVVSLYEGQVIDGKANGIGRIIFEDGSYYLGDFWDDLFEGSGEYYSADGNYYQGSFMGGLQHGYGVEKWKSGRKYQGEFKNGQKDGKGTLIFQKMLAPKNEDDQNQQPAQGLQTNEFIYEKYEGNFKDGQFHGKGEYWWIDGRYYNGEFFEGTMHGKGIFRWPNGMTYDGGYFDDQRSGWGKFYWQKKKDDKDPIEEIYIEGQWRDGKLEGEGIFVKGKHNIRGELKKTEQGFQFIPKQLDPNTPNNLNRCQENGFNQEKSAELIFIEQQNIQN